MDKEKREKGEKYLKNWGQGILDIQNLQTEINQIRKNNDAFDTIQIENKEDIVNIYSSVINEKLVKLKNLMYEYKIVDDVISNLEDYQKDVIRFRYIYKNSWQSVALKVHISLRQCFNIKNLVINRILKSI
ncbi:hypothetical protein [uncultured Tyzzerella sp.]|uniref:hypothetical protein n=1 Tax=uncultured Tyzzerella sp. TaxID=2321398 RepID=UPI002942E571|nr:hypothetical protein [uncultured Tyzzerella sp.]